MGGPGRGFLREVGIVVLGVLLALAAQQAAEWLDWRQRTALAVDALGFELVDSRLSADERIRIFACIDRRLDELAAIVDAADRTGRLPPMGALGLPPSRTWSTATWLSVQNSELAGHLPTGQRLLYAGIYTDLANISARQTTEQVDWTELQQLTGPGRRFDPAEARALRLAIGRARFANRYLGLVAAQLLAELRMDGLRLPRVSAADSASYTRPLGQRPICRPIARMGPPHYGQAPWQEVLPFIVRQPGDAGPPPAPPYPSR